MSVIGHPEKKIIEKESVKLKDFHIIRLYRICIFLLWVTMEQNVKINKKQIPLKPANVVAKKNCSSWWTEIL